MPRHKRQYHSFASLCVLAVLFLCSLFFVPEVHAVSYWRDQSVVAKRYTLYGTIDLTYERDWTEGSPAGAINTFTQTYDLGVRGFVVDPRLVGFDVAGMFTNTSSKYVDYTLQGVRLNVILLEELPRTGKALKYLPNPVRLRFTDYSNPYHYKNYGVSIRYTVPEEILFYKKKDSRNKLHVPVLYFDYDKYKYNAQNYRISTDIYSLRATMTGEHYDYRLLYEIQNQAGTVAYNRQTFELLPTYRFYDEKTRRVIDIFSTLRFEKINDTKTLNIQVLPRYYQPIGKDLRLVTGNLNYSKISSPDQDTEAYSSSVSASYTKVISPRLTNSTTLSVGAGKSGSETLHFERISDSLSADLSRTFGATGSVSIGNNERGGEYGAEGFVYTKTRVRTTAGYAISSTPDVSGRTVTNRFYLSAAGPILRAASFDTTAQYITRRVGDSGSLQIQCIDPTGNVHPCSTAFEENLLFLSSNVYWYIGKTSFTAGGSYSQTVNKTDHENRTSFAFLYANMSRYLTPRTFLNLYTTWEQDDNDVTRFELRPSLTWRRGMTLVGVEYDYIRTSRGTEDVEPTNDHRLMVRFIRNLYYNIY